MWTHLLEAIFSWLVIPVFPILLMVAMMSAEVILDRTLQLFRPQRNRNDNSARISTNGLT